MSSLTRRLPRPRLALEGSTEHGSKAQQFLVSHDLAPVPPADRAWACEFHYGQCEV